MSKTVITVVRIGEQSWSSDEDGGIIISGRISLSEGDASSSARVSLGDPRLELASSLPLPYSNNRVPFEVWFGYGPTVPKVFSGWLSSIRPGGLPGRTEVYATDKAKSMRKVPRARSLGETSMSALVNTLAREHSLNVDLSGAPQLDDLRFASVLQHGESDWDTIQRLVQSAGCTAYERGGTLFVRKTGSTRDNHNTVVAEFGVNVRNGFSFSIDELTRDTTPNVFDIEGDRTFEAAFDPEATERMVQLERTGLTLRNQDSPSFTSQASQRAQRAQSRAKELFKGSITFEEAHPEIDVDDMAELRGFGPRFSGFWNIKEVEHNIKQGTTTLDIYNGGSQ
jgi:phage protein D